MMGTNQSAMALAGAKFGQAKGIACKNYHRFTRRPFLVVLIALLPSITLCALSALFQSLNTLDNSLRPLEVSPCTSYSVYGAAYYPQVPCCSLLYAPAGNPVVDAIMTRVAAQTGLVLGMDLIGVASETDAAYWVFDHIQTTLVDHAVIFNTSIGSSGNAPFNGTVQYILWVNVSTVQGAALAGRDAIWRTMGVPGRPLAWQKEIDAAIIAYGASLSINTKFDSPQPDPRCPVSPIDVRMAAFSDWTPTTDVGVGTDDSNSSPGVKMLLVVGGAILALGPILSALIFSTLIVDELASGMKAYMCSNGLQEAAYVTGWLALAVPFAIVGALLAPLFGMASGLSLFYAVDYTVLACGLALFLLSSFSQAMCCITMCFSSPRSSRARTSGRCNANVPSLSLVAATLVINTLCAALNIYPTVYAPGATLFTDAILLALPSFHYGRYVQSILSIVYTGSPPALGPPASLPGTSSRRTGQSLEELDGVLSSQFTWRDLLTSPVPTIVYTEDSAVLWHDYPPLFDWFMLALLSVAYAVGAWYCGVKASRGMCMCCPSIDCRRLGAASSYCGRKYARINNQYRDEGEGVAEVQRLSALEGSLRITNLSKSCMDSEHNGSGRGCCNNLSLTSPAPSILRSLSEITLTVPPCKVLVLLGKSGCGKSTLMLCLLGSASVDAGQAFLGGHRLCSAWGASVWRRDTGACRMGYCPQGDVLWDSLSAAQHLRLMGRLRGIHEALLESRVGAMLAAAGLGHFADHPHARDLSCGARRKLTLAMAAMGSPRILFLDEPTAGLDFTARQEVWTFIAALRTAGTRQAGSTGPIVVVATRQADEAEALGDIVAIMSAGCVRAVGSPLYLKRKFGAGFTVRIVCDRSRLKEASRAVEWYLPAAGGAGRTGGARVHVEKQVDTATVTVTVACTPRSGTSSRVAESLSTALPPLLRWVQASHARVPCSPANREGADAARPDTTVQPGLVRDWSVTSASMEEAFARCTAGIPHSTPEAEWNREEAEWANPMSTIPIGSPVALVPRPEWPATAHASHDPAAADAAHGDAHAQCTRPEPRRVSGWAQMFALFHARLRLMRVSGAFLHAAVLTAVGSYLHIILSPSASSQGDLTLCAGGYLTDNATTGLCDRDVFARYMTGAIGRANYCNGTAPGERDGEGPIPDAPFPMALLMWRAVCPTHEPVTGACTASAPTTTADKGQWPISVDWAQTRSVSASVALNTAPVSAPLYIAAVGGDERVTPVVWHYKEDDEAVTEGRLVPLSHWDMFGPAAGDAYVRMDGRIVWPWVAELRPAPTPYPPPSGPTAGAAAIDQSCSAAMRHVYTSALPVTNGTCGANDMGVRIGGSGLGSGSTRVAWIWTAEQVASASEWTIANLPSVGVTVQAACMGKGAGQTSTCCGPHLSYDLQLWAAQCSSTLGATSWCPTRANGYTWAGGGGGAILVNTEEAPAGREPSVCVENGLQPSGDWPWYSPYDRPGPFPASAALSAMHNAFFRSMVQRTNLTARLTAPVIRTAWVALPTLSWHAFGPGEDASAYPSLLWPLFSLLLLPMQASWVAMEGGAEGSMHGLMGLSGMRTGPYFGGTYLYALLVGVFARSVIVCTGQWFGGGGSAFTAAGWRLWTSLILCTAHEQAGVATLIGIAVPSQWTASSTSYATALTISLASFLVSSYVRPWPAALTWTPLMCSARAAALVFVYGGSRIDPRDELSLALRAAVLYGCLSMGLAVLVHSACWGKKGRWGGVWARMATAGDRIGALRCVMRSQVVLRHAFSCCNERAGVRVRGQGLAPGASVHAATASGSASWVYSRLSSAEGAHAEGAHAEGAHAEMHEDAHAGMCVREGERLCILGPNGADKNSILAKVTLHTSQGGHMAGNSVGMCPQYDVMWPLLSVRHHLEFFAALKGLQSPASAACEMMTRVGLESVYDEAAGTLSSVHRRVLSISIAMLGDPSLLLLDDPTSGLDRAACSQVHRILTAHMARPGRAMVLATSSIEEAESLCGSGRVVVVCQGRIRAVGMPCALKWRFGGAGLTLTLNLDPMATSSCSSSGQCEELSVIASKAMEFVRARVHARATVRWRVAGTLLVDLPGHPRGPRTAEQGSAGVGLDTAEMASDHALNDQDECLDIGAVFTTMQGRMLLQPSPSNSASSSASSAALPFSPSAVSAAGSAGISTAAEACFSVDGADTEAATTGGACIAEWALTPMRMEDAYTVAMGQEEDAV